MRFVIVGPGALGSVIAAALTQGGHEVSLLGRPSAHLRALQENGLTLITRDGERQAVALHATDDSAVVTRADAIVVLVKSGDTVAAMEAIKPHVHSRHVILTLQNGLGNTARIREILGDRSHILAGVTSQAATRNEPGSVVHTGTGPTLIGFLDKRDASIAVELAGVFASSGLPAAPVTDIERRIWEKLAVNAAINGLTGLGQFPNGVVASNPSMLDAAEIVAEEVASVARTKGIEIGDTRRAVLETAAATADNRSSMLQDLDAGRQTEVEAIHGAILAAGEELGIATPAIRVLYALIKEKEQDVTRPATEQIDG